MYDDPDARNEFLRKVKRTPLRKRAFGVFGPRAPSILKTLEQANPGMPEESFERYVRNVLRRCAAIQDKNAERRRLAYVQACSIPFRAKEQATEETPLALLVKITGSQKLAEKKLVQLFRVTAKRVGDLYDPIEEALDLIRRAATKKYPARYLDTIIRNDRKKPTRKQGKAR